MPTVLIIGAGPNIGEASAEAFLAAGYQVAVASRTQKLDAKFRHFSFDASKPDTVPALFEKVSKDLGIPSVVIFNAAAGKITAPDKPFDVDLDAFQQNFNVNAITPYIVARETVNGFEKLGSSGLGPTGGTFIFTGNILNITALPRFMPFGMQKSASAHLIQHLAVAVYNDKPYKFYYVDQRRETGWYVTSDLDGPAHAEHFLHLVKDAKQGPWDQTFVKGKGYVEFPRQEFLEFIP
ncbi:NAD(P)-binding protein [Hypoxylon sp. FL1857]|nr:NAD(P)-binding protein [Hypoxylon sp. FL1857]